MKSQFLSEAPGGTTAQHTSKVFIKGTFVCVAKFIKLYSTRKVPLGSFSVDAAQRETDQKQHRARCEEPKNHLHIPTSRLRSHKHPVPSSWFYRRPLAELSVLLQVQDKKTPLFQFLFGHLEQKVKRSSENAERNVQLQYY